MSAIIQKNFSLWQAVKYGFATYFKHIGLMLAATLLYTVYVALGLSIGYFIYQIWSMFSPSIMPISQIMNGINGIDESVQQQFMIDLKANTKTLAALGISFAASFIGFMIASIAGSAGLTNIALKIYDQSTATLSDFFLSCSEYWRYFKTSMLFIAIMMLGMICFIIPGFIAIAFFIFAPFIVLDTPAGTIESLKESRKITAGSRWKLLISVWLLGIIGGGIGGLVLPLGFAQLFSFLISPLAMLIWVYIYKTLKAQTPDAII